MVDVKTRSAVFARAGALPHVKDDSLANLALSCPRCNFRKGTNLSGIDPVTGAVVNLFNPRQDVWVQHFKWQGPLIQAQTAVGRATVAVLDLNGGDRLRLRTQIIAESGQFE